MRLKVVSFCVFFLIPFCPWAAEARPLIATNAEKAVWIVPLTNRSEARYPNSDIYRLMIQRSLVSFIGLIPGLSITDLSDPSDGEVVFQEGKWPSGSSVPEFVVSGGYQLRGSLESPEIEVNIKIYSRDDPAKAFYTKSYRSETGLDLFDTLDLLIADSARAVVKTDVNIATLNFSGFEVGTEPHFLFLNERLVALVTNQGFSLSLKVPADTEYRIEIKKLFGLSRTEAWRKAMEISGTNGGFQLKLLSFLNQLYPVSRASVKLSARQSTNIGYRAYGKVEFYPIRNRKAEATYSISVDGQTMPFASSLLLPSGTNYRVRVLRASNEICVSNFYLFSRYDETNDKNLIRPSNPYRRMVPQDGGVIWSEGTSLQGAFRVWSGVMGGGDTNFSAAGFDLTLAAYFSLFDASWNPFGLFGELVAFPTQDNASYLLNLWIENYFYDWGNFALKGMIGLGVDAVNGYSGADTNSDGDQNAFCVNIGVGIPVRLFSWLVWDNSLKYYTDVGNFNLFRLDTQLQARWGVLVLEGGLSYWTLPGVKQDDNRSIWGNALFGNLGGKLQFDF